MTGFIISFVGFQIMDSPCRLSSILKCLFRAIKIQTNSEPNLKEEKVEECLDSYDMDRVPA